MSAWWARFVERHAPLMDGQYSAWDNLDGLTGLPDGDESALEVDVSPRAERVTLTEVS